MQVASRLQHTQEYYFSQKLREIEGLNKTGPTVINLGIGSPDLPPHPRVVAALTAAAARPDTHAYQSYKGVAALRQAMSGWYQRQYGVTLDPETEILPLLGSKEGIIHVSMTLLEAGDEVLIPNPGYPAYRAAAHLSGATPVLYDLTAESGWLPDLDALAAQDLSRVKLMWVNYPHMPTGTPPPAGFFERLVAFATAHNILLVHDNPYSFILNEQPAAESAGGAGGAGGGAGAELAEQVAQHGGLAGGPAGRPGRCAPGGAALQEQPRFGHVPAGAAGRRGSPQPR